MSSSRGAAKDCALPRVSCKAEAALVAAARPLPLSQHRSTADQRQAFLEHLYSDYSELHAQQDEIHDRKNQMDFDMFESNQQEIHDVLFANVEATDGALGDWDTWEKVEATMKRYAYGRPQHTKQEKEEDAAMRSRIEALDEVACECNATIRALAQACTAAQQEVGGLRKLLHAKDNEVKTLSNQNHIAALQLHYVQRECAALRGMRNENETTLLKQDLSYLIEASKRLEAENQRLRGRQQVVEAALREPKAGVAATASVAVAAAAKAAPPALSPATPQPSEEQSSAFTPMELSMQPIAAKDEDLDRCLKDDNFRRQFLMKEVPLSGAVVNAKRMTASWKRRLEAEVHSALEILDRDAAAPLEVADVVSSAAWPWRGTQSDGASQMQNGVFISHASYEGTPRKCSDEQTVPVLMAPTISPLPTATATAAANLPATTSSPTPPSSPLTGSSTAEMARRSAEDEAAALSVPTVGALSAASDIESAAASSDPRKGVHKSVASVANDSARASHANAPAPQKTPHTAAHVPKRRSVVVAAAKPVFAPLQSAVLRCAELSRANAMRRELLHVAHLRQMLADEMARASADRASQLASQSNMPQSARDVSLGTVADIVATASPPMETSLTQSPPSAEVAATSVPERLRQQVEKSRTSSPAAMAGETPELDGGEVQSSAVFGTAATAAGSPSSADAATAHHGTPTPTPPPPLSLSSSLRLSNSRRRCADHARACVGSLSALVLPLRHHAAALQHEVAELRASAVTYSAELLEALALLGRAFNEHETRVVQMTEDQATEKAMTVATERVLEAAALQRTAQILKDRFGAALPANAFTPAALPETATDEEWLVNELHAAAAAMIKESVQPRVGPPTEERGIPVNGGATKVRSTAARPAGQLAQASAAAVVPSRLPPSRPSRQYAKPVEQDYFETEVLRPFRLQPNFGNGGAARNKAGAPFFDALWAGNDADDEEEEETASNAATRAAGRAVGCVDGRARNRPALPAQWHWRTRTGYDIGGALHNSAAESRPVLPPRRPTTFTAATTTVTQSSQTPSPADVQSIQPTVLRYVFGGATESTPCFASRQIQEGTAFLFGKEFEGFVQEYIFPVISTANRISADGRMDPAMRAAVEDLREKERARRKRGVRLLFDRVVNSIRTRRLLRRNVYQGEAFVSFVGLLYRNWRTKLERNLRCVQSAQATNRNALFSLLRLKPFVSPGDAFTKPAPPSSHLPGKTKTGTGTSKPVVNAALVKSSFHFDKAKFNTPS